MEERRPTRNPLRRLYRWTEAWADRPGGAAALFVLALVEAVFFPVPPDVLLLALGAQKPRRALLFAAITTAGSVTGAVAGYLLGMLFPDVAPAGHEVAQMVRENVFWAVLVAAFTPIPFKVFTVLSGFLSAPFVPFVGAAILGRGARFFAVGFALFLVGPRVRPWIERNLELATVGIVLLVAAVLALFHFLG